MIQKSGKEMWRKLDKIGPKIKQHILPNEIIINGGIETDTDTVMAVWVDTFTSLYEAIPDTDSGYEREFLEQVKLQATSIERTNKLNFTDTLNSPVTSTEVRNAVKEAGNGKAVSVDRLPNETFKNNSSIECLTALF